MTYSRDQNRGSIDDHTHPTSDLQSQRCEAHAKSFAGETHSASVSLEP